MFDLDPEQLRTYRPHVAEPDDFDQFWRATLAETDEHDLAPDFRKISTRLETVDSYDVSFAGFGGNMIKGWLTVPAGSNHQLPAVVEYLGYSGGRGHPYSRTLFAAAGWAHLVMDTRGQGWKSGGPETTPDAAPEAGLAHAPGFMTAGITDPRTYYYRRVYADALRCLQAAGSSALIDPAKIIVTGKSQGGGLAIAAAGLAEYAGIRLLGCAPDVPFLCHFERAIRITDRDPYGEIARYLAGWREHAEAAYATLSYMDAANLARRATAPAFFSTGLMDLTCPPSTVFAAYNRYAELAADAVETSIKVYQHNDHEGGGDDQVGALLEWFSQLVRTA